MKNVYHIENGLNKLSDGRVNPTYKTAQVITLVLLGFLLRIKSFNELNLMIKNNEFSKLFARGIKIPKVDTIRDTLKVIDIKGLKQINQQIVKKAIGNKVFENGAIDRYTVVAIDGTKFFGSNKKSCAECLKNIKVEKTHFAGRVICGCCGSTFGRKVWNSTYERLRRVVWRCNKKYEVKGKKSCENKHIADKVLYKVFVEAFNAMIINKDYFMEKWRARKDDENVLVRYKVQQFIEIIKEAEEFEKFDIDIYFKIIEKLIVFEGNKIIVVLLDGTEVEVVSE